MLPWAKELAEWHEFYVLLGTAAATLTGLMFVAVSVAPHVIAARGGSGVRAFVTPVVTHFAAVLVASLVPLIPALSSAALAMLMALGSILGLAYVLWTRAHRQWQRSKLEIDDWIWYIGLPSIGYLLILCASIAVWLHRPLGLEGLCAAALLLLVAGLRNAWDLLLFLAQQPRNER